MSDSNAASSPAPQHKEVEHFTDEERTTWLKTGEMPALPPVEDESATSKPAADKGGKKAESGTAPKGDADKNWKELREARERAEKRAADLEAELTELKKPKAEPAKKEEPAAATAPKILEAPKRPKAAEFIDDAGNFNIAKYDEALEKYEGDKDAYGRQQAQLQGAKAEQERALKTWGSDLKAKYGDAASKVDVKKTVDQLVSTLNDAPAFFAFLNDSEVFTDLLYVLGTDENLPALIEEAKKNPTKAVRRLIALEAGVLDQLAKDAEVKKKANGSAEGEQPGGRKLTQAGKPPSESSGSSSSPTDDGTPEAAWRRKDLSKDERGELYRTRMNEKERKARKKSN